MSLDLRKLLGNRFKRGERLFWLTAIPGSVLLVGAAVYFLTRQPACDAPVPQPSGPLAPQATPTPDPVAEIAAAYESGNHGRAETLLSAMDLESANNPRAWALAGLLAEARGDREAAMSAYDRGIAKSPSGGLYCRRAILLLASGDPEAALSDLEAAIPLDRSDNFLANARLITLVQLGRSAEVREEIDRQHGLTGDAGPWVFGLAALALEGGEFPQAAELLAIGRGAVGPGAYKALLALPPLSKYQCQPAILPFYLENST